MRLKYNLNNTVNGITELVMWMKFGFYIYLLLVNMLMIETDLLVVICLIKLNTLFLIFEKQFWQRMVLNYYWKCYKCVNVAKLFPYLNPDLLIVLTVSKWINKFWPYNRWNSFSPGHVWGGAEMFLAQHTSHNWYLDIQTGKETQVMLCHICWTLGCMYMK